MDNGRWIVDLALELPAPGTSFMLSRVAENLYWIARYVERAEGLARLLEQAYSLELEAGGMTGVRPLENVLQMLSATEAYEAYKREPAAAAAVAGPSGGGGGIGQQPVEEWDEILYFLTFFRKDAFSLRGMVARARENARGTQEAFTGEAWSQLNKLHLFLNGDRAARMFRATTTRVHDRVRRDCVLFRALVQASMPRTEGYHFLLVGRYLERIDLLSRIINVHCHTTTPNGEPAFLPSHWVDLLRATSAHEAFVTHCRDRVDPVSVVRYLLLEADFPRSMRFAVGRCLESLRAITGVGSGYGSDAERHLGRLESELRYMDVEELFARGIGPFLVSVQEVCALVGRDIHGAYFRT